MAWVGGAKVEGASPGDVRVGDFVLPARARWTFTGEVGSPSVIAEFAVIEGRPQCVDVRVSAAKGGRQVRTSDLQLLSLDALTVAVFVQLGLRAQWDPETNVTTLEPVMDEREIWRLVSATEDAVKAPRRGTTDAELAQVAQVYTDNIDDKPVQAVQAVLGYGSERTAARRVQQARAAGLLPETTPGKRLAGESTKSVQPATQRAGARSSGEDSTDVAGAPDAAARAAWAHRHPEGSEGS